ncbi:MAG: hypothetical protein WKF75_03480 [Singulisphaera sp.]
MKRLGLNLLAAVVVSLVSPAANAVDLGSFIEAARELVQRSLLRKNRALTGPPRRALLGETADGWTLVAPVSAARPARPGASSSCTA